MEGTDFRLFYFLLHDHCLLIIDLFQFCFRNKNMEQFGTNGPNIALNVNLALNMDSNNQNGKASKSDANNMSVRKSLTSDTHSSITVAVRMRPLLEKEKSLKADLMMRDNHVVIPSRKETFQFDHCLNSAEQEKFEYASQDIVYRKMAEPLLKEAFKGYNTCLFAYGQSGSGEFAFTFPDFY